MKRGKGLKRTPFVSRAAPLKGGFLKRGAFVRKGPPPVFKPVRRPRHLPKVLRDLLWGQSEGLCDLCGIQLPVKGWHAHHRKLKSQGGRDETANLLALHFPCHDRIHDNPTWSKQRGYIVHPSYDPATRPVHRHERVWSLPKAGHWVATEYQKEAA
jgi:hypothetical protein